jgi:integrase
MKKSFPQPFLSITRTDIHDYKIKRLSQVSGSTVREEIQSIHKLFNWAEREMIFGDITISSPARNIALPPPSKPNERVVSQAEFAKLLSELNPRMQEIVEIAWETAMRRSEIINLKVRHLDLNAKTLTVENGKTGDRIVPLTSKAIEILRYAAARCCSPETRLYPVAPHSVSTALRRARNRAGLGDHVKMHQLRHTRITALARKGLNQAQIMIVSGHRDVTSLHRYTHLNVTDVLELLE